LQSFCALGVMMKLFSRRMRYAIDLHDDLALAAGKVSEEKVDGALAQELQIVKATTTQSGPHPIFGRRLVGAQNTRAVGSPGLSAPHWWAPCRLSSKRPPLTLTLSP
jgi:hypothetical protein